MFLLHFISKKYSNNFIFHAKLKKKTLLIRIKKVILFSVKIHIVIGENTFQLVCNLSLSRWASLLRLACSFEPLSIGKSLQSSWFTYLDGAIDWGSLTSLFTVGLFTCGDSRLDVDNSSNVLEVSGASNRPTSLILLIASGWSDVKFPFFTTN